MPDLDRLASLLAGFRVTTQQQSSFFEDGSGIVWIYRAPRREEKGAGR
jgi:hypothetical protein